MYSSRELAARIEHFQAILSVDDQQPARRRWAEAELATLEQMQNDGGGNPNHDPQTGEFTSGGDAPMAAIRVLGSKIVYAAPIHIQAVEKARAAGEAVGTSGFQSGFVRGTTFHPGEWGTIYAAPTPFLMEKIGELSPDSEELRTTAGVTVVHGGGNPNHDPTTGEFASGGGVSGGPLRDESKPGGAALSRHLDQRFKNFAPLSRDELSAVDDYMTAHYQLYNAGLRSGNPDAYFATRTDEPATAAEWKAGIAQMDNVMGRMPTLGESAVVYRSVDNVEWLSGAIGERGTLPTLENASKLVGMTITDGGFVSTTTSQRSAWGWSKLNSGGTLIEIHLPPSTRGMWAKIVAPEQQSQAIVKHEYLLPRGAKFKIAGASVEGGIQSRAVLHLNVEYVP